MCALEERVSTNIVLVNRLVPDLSPVIVPYGDENCVVFHSDGGVMSRYINNTISSTDLIKAIEKYSGKKATPEIVLETMRDWEIKHNKWTGLLNRIKRDFRDRGDQIVMSLREAAINYEEHRNLMDISEEIRVYPWRAVEHLCFAINSTGKPNYNFKPESVRLTPVDPLTGQVYMGERGRGHIIMGEFSDLLVYDEHGGMYIYFNLPEEHWLKETS